MIFPLQQEPKIFSMTLTLSNPNEENADTHMYNFVGIARDQAEAHKKALEQIQKNDHALFELSKVYGGFEMVCSVFLTMDQVTKGLAQYGYRYIPGVGAAEPPMPNMVQKSDRDIGVISDMMSYVLNKKDKELYKALMPHLSQYERELMENSRNFQESL